MKNSNKSLNRRTSLVLAALALSALFVFSESATAVTHFNQLNLVTDEFSPNPPPISDANLVNAWGISYGPTGPFWVSDNGKGVSTLYDVTPAANATTTLGLVVTIPGVGNVTGQVFNGASASGAFNGNNFLFVSEDGTISGWRSALGTHAETLVTGSSANLYKGVAEAAFNGNSYLYAANFKAGTIDVLKGSAAAPDLVGHFTDPTLPAGYAPFNIQSLNDRLFVTYAQQDPASPDEVAGAGKGFVSVFDNEGGFLGRVASQGALNAPWGLAIAPSSFGEFAGNLLVGNFGDGTINAYNPANGNFVGQLTDSNGQPLAIEGLWALTVGNDTRAGNSQTLYFSAGPGDEEHGLFGAITVMPVPGAAWLFGSALIGFIGFRTRSDGPSR